MVNYLLFWEVKNESRPEEYELSQQAKELWKLYSIPGDDPASFKLAAPIDGDVFCQVARSREREQVMKQISLEIGCETEWRLVIFLMKDVNLLDGGKCFGIVDFLAHVMNYDSSSRNSSWKLEDCFLTCPQPEGIWLVTLGNDPANALPSFSPPVRSDEKSYSSYPPNCRFLRFKLDYHFQNNFSTKMLELHCGMRSLARDFLPTEVLQGNCVYEMEVDLDVATFYDTIVEYDQWLGYVERAILQEETRLRVDWLKPGSAPATSNMPVGKPGIRLTPNHKRPEATLEQLENEIDRVLEQDSMEERVRLKNTSEQLNRWARQQSWMMAANTEKEWQREMEEIEQSMLSNHAQQGNFWKRLWQLILALGNILFNMNGSLGELHPFASQSAENVRDEWRVLKRKYLDSVQIWKEMKCDCVQKIVRASITTLSGCLVVFYVLDQLKRSPELGVMVLVLIASLLFTGLVYIVYMLYYWFRYKRVYGNIIDRQTDRLTNSREYFNQMALYFRYSQVLAINGQMKQEAEKKKSLLIKQKKKLEYYRTICSQLKLCCAGQQVSGKMTTRMGSIAGMLQNDMHLQLFRMSGSLPTLTLNGTRITAAFPFIRAIRLVRLAW